MGISSYGDLRQWFFAGVKQKGEETTEAAPHWNLYAGDYGAREVRIMFNNRISDMAESFQFLENSIRAQNNPDGTRFRVQTYAPGKPNNPTAETYVQIYEKSAAPATAQPAIGSLPVGMQGVEAYVNQRVELAQLQWENKMLQDQLSAPQATWERVLEQVAGIHGIDKVLQALAVGLVSKFSPQAMPAVQAAMNGTPAATSGEHEHDDESASPDEIFQQNIMQVSAALGTDPVTLSKKLNALIREHPDLAKTLMTA